MFTGIGSAAHVYQDPSLCIPLDPSLKVALWSKHDAPHPELIHIPVMKEKGKSHMSAEPDPLARNFPRNLTSTCISLPTIGLHYHC